MMKTKIKDLFKIMRPKWNNRLNNNQKSINPNIKMKSYLRNQVNKVRSQERVKNLRGQRLKSKKRRKRNKKLMIFLSLPMSWTMTSIWKIKKSNLPLKSLRIVLPKLRKTKIGRSSLPRNGTRKLSKPTCSQPRYLCRPTPDPKDQRGRAFIHTVSRDFSYTF